MSFVVHRVAKSAARYTDAGGREKCGYCRFFVAPRACGKVIGPVSPAGWCKYFSRQMVSQYGGGTPISGPSGPAPPTFNQSLLGGSLGAGAAFTRASTGWSYNSSGVLVSSAINAPRFDYDPVTLQPRGVLMEDTSTNLAFRSGDMHNGSWNVQGSPTPPTMTGNVVASPDGATTATRLVFPAVSSNYSYLGQGFTLTAVPHAVSVWLRGNAGGEQIYVGVTTGAVQYSTARLTLTTNWQRYSVITPALTAGGWTFQIGTDFRGGSQTSTPAQTVYAWGAQLEASSYVSSYIPTIAVAVTRAIDVLSYPIASVTGFDATQGTILFQGSYLGQRAGFYGSLASLVGANSALDMINMFVQQSNSSFGTNIKVAGAQPYLAGSTPNNVVPGAIIKTGIAYNAAAANSAINGVVLGAGAAPGTLPVITALSVMGFVNSNNQPSGWARGVQYYPRPLPPAELITVTT